MKAEERLDQITSALTALKVAWPVLGVLLKERAEALTLDLISQDNEQTRGRIKELRALLNLPDTLQAERDGIASGLADQAPEIS